MRSHPSRNRIDVEALGRSQPETSRHAVRTAAARKVEQRRSSLESRIRNPQRLQHLAAELRLRVLDRLDGLLVEAERQLTANGIHVHWAETAREACEIVAALCLQSHRASDPPLTVVKSKSMVTEEIHLNEYLEKQGIHPTETDLGEFVVQLDGDRPTHIVTPIIQKSRRDVAATFKKAGLGEYSEDPAILTQQARVWLRERFRTADVGITGANFVVAETGRIFLLTNEGNGRMSTVTPRLHIAITGIEKIVERERDLSVLLKLLARSSTGQDLTVYTNVLGGPRKPGEADGPEEVHLVFLDNGRSRILGSRYREMLRCIRCGACLNVCPVYRQVTGHGYASVYPGPMGAVLSPLLEKPEPGKGYGDLPRASTLCGACREVCPVGIPIPEYLLSLRDEFYDPALHSDSTPPFGPWAILCSHPAGWRFALDTARRMGWTVPGLPPLKVLSRWMESRELPEWPRTSFRSWWENRNPKGEESP